MTVCYNAAESIEKTIQSVTSQTYSNIEYLIIDGGSTDGTLDIIDRYRHKISKIVSEPDKGIYDAMNKGIRLCTGELINFMNAGDTFVDENTLTKVMDYVEEDSDVIYGDMISILDNIEIYSKAGFFTDHDANLPFCHQSVLVRAEYAKEYPFDLRYRIVGDYDFFYKLYTQGKKFQYITIPVTRYSFGGFSYNYRAAAYKEVSEITKKKKNLRYYLKLNTIKLKMSFFRILPDSVKYEYLKARYGG